MEKLFIKTLQNLIYIFLTISLSHCIPQTSQPLPEANILSKAGSIKNSLPQRTVQNQKAVFVEEKKITIVKVEEPNTNGSLYNLDDERNYLFVEKAPMTVGRYLTIKIVSNRDLRKTVGKVEDEEKDNDKNKSTGDDNELIKSLPSLEPDENNLAVLKEFKVKVAHLYPNGDVLVVTKRESMNGSERREIVVQARIPYNSLISGEGLSTNELINVNLVDDAGDELTERSSASWEDDYTLRLSGFTEAKSKAVARLEDKRKQLVGVKERMRNRLVSMGKERKQMAKERNDLMLKGQRSEEKIVSLAKSIEQKDSTITNQKEMIVEKDKQILELSNPENKPSDSEDGVSDE